MKCLLSMLREAVYLLAGATLIALSVPAEVRALDRDCLPSVRVPIYVSSELRSATTAFGTGYQWWCLIDTDAEGRQTWRRNNLIVPNTARDMRRFGEATGRVLASPNPMATANAEIQAASVAPVAGTMEDYERQRLGYLSCLEVIKPPLPAVFVDLPTCGAAPVPPTKIWWVPKAAIIANPVGTRPTYMLTTTVSGATTIKADGLRIPEFTACGRTLLVGTTSYGTVAAERWSVCVEKP